MALSKETLKIELQKIFDQEYSGFLKFPESLVEAADKWSSAILKYSSTIIPPSTTGNAAKLAMQSQLATIQDSNGAIVFPKSIMAFATALSVGMLPNYTGTPPTTPLIMEPIWDIGIEGCSSEQIAGALADLIDSWFKTGIAILVAPPNTPIIWS